MSDRNTVEFSRPGFKMVIREMEDGDVFLAISSHGGIGGSIVIPRGQRERCIEALSLAQASLKTWHDRDTQSSET